MQDIFNFKNAIYGHTIGSKVWHMILEHAQGAVAVTYSLDCLYAISADDDLSQREEIVRQVAEVLKSKSYSFEFVNLVRKRMGLQTESKIWHSQVPQSSQSSRCHDIF